METVVEKTVQTYGMEPLLSHVLVGYSGGADSSALLHWLLAYSRKHGTRVSALHVHHGIRGASADRDALHCRRVCEEWGIPLQVIYADVPDLARRTGRGVEETARQVRYEAFARAREADPTITAVATAHNAEDNAETVLYHLARGCGADGIAGIPPVNDLGVIRPLIRCTRAEIIAYCQGNTISYTEDETNGDTRYRRNHIRHNVLPLLKEINPDLPGAVSRMSHSVREDAAYLDTLAAEAHRSLGGGSTASGQAVNALPYPIRTRVLRRMYRAAGGEELAHVHVEAILSVLAGARTDRDLDLPGGVIFSVARDLICFRLREEEAVPPVLLTEGMNVLDGWGIAVFLSFDGKKPEYNENIYKLSTYQPINFDKINGKVFVRSRKDGDRYRTKGMTKSVKRWLCDAHVPRWLRHRVPLFCDDRGILYVRGMGLRDDCKVTPDCRVLHLYLFEREPY